MTIPPLQFAGALAAAAPLAESALSGVSATFADLLAAATPRDSGDDAAAPGLGLDGLTSGMPIAAGEERLRSETQSLLGRFHQLLQGLLANRSVELDGEVQLQSDADGNVRAAGSTGDTSLFEELFAANPELRQLFDRIASNARMLGAVEQVAEGSAAAGAPSAADGITIVADKHRAAIAG